MNYTCKVWMFVSAMSSALIAAIVCIFLFVKDKKPYLGIIALGWSIFFIDRLLGLFSAFNDIKIICSLRYALYYVSVFLFVYGMYLFIEKAMKKWWIVAFSICAIYTSLAILTDLPHFFQNVLFIFPGVILIWTGILIIKSKKNMKIGKYIVAGDFTVWGVYLIGYALLGNTKWLISIGNFISSLVFNVFVFGFLILYFETILLRLQRSEEEYKLLVELSPNAIGVVVDDKIVFANNAALKLFKANDIHQIKGHKVNEFLHSDYFQYGEERFKKVLNTQKHDMHNEIRIKALDGTFIEIEGSMVPFTYNNINGVLGIARDITELKRTERLKKGIEEKTRLLKEAEELELLRNEFFANISHELRTPLNIILGSIQLFERYNGNIHDKTNLDYKKYVRIIKQNCFRLLKLVNNLIDMTKIDTGFCTTNFGNCDIVSIVENITLSVVDYAKNKNISLIFDTDVEEKIIACDPDKIERIVLNLLSNAIKFTEPEGHILVTLNDNTDNINIIVKDDGIGIPEDKQSVVFERFKQVENTLSRSTQGSGIGLSLVKSLVQMHEGDINIKSKCGKGTEFIIKLPVRTIEEKNTIKKSNFTMNQTLIERISIEFSDIYGA